MHGFPAYVGIGSNLRDPQVQVRAAFAALAQIPNTRLWLSSSLYGSLPMGPVDQPDYCNAVAGLLTELDVDGLFSALRAIEVRMGRERSLEPPLGRWGPRVIDLDLLVYGECQRADATLTLPHPGLTERHFVLQPLNEIAPDLPVPGRALVRTLAAAVATDGLWKLA